MSKKPGIDRRSFLQLSAAGAGALAIGAGADHLVNETDLFGYEHRLDSLEDPEEKIAHSKAEYDGNPRSRKGQPNFRELSERAVNGAEDQTRAEFISNFFSDTETVVPQIRNRHSGKFMLEWLDNFQRIPEPVRQRLSKIVPGQVAQESKFDNGLVNPRSRARTVWQIIPDVYAKEAKETATTMASLKTSTKVAFYNYERIYTVFKNGVEIPDLNIDVEGLDFEAFKRRFGLSEDQWNNFLALAMLNAYNTGERRMLEIMHWFKDNFSLSDVAQIENQTELGLFSMMADLARTSGKFSRYGEESNEYVFKSLGAAKSLSHTNRLAFAEIDAVDSPVNVASRWVKNRITDTGVPILVGAAGGLAVDNGFETAKQNPSKLRKKASRSERYADKVWRYVQTALQRSWRGGKAVINEKEEVKKQGKKPAHEVTRREVLKGGGAALGVSAAGLTAHRYREEIGEMMSEFVTDLSEVIGHEGEISKSEVPKVIAHLKSRGIFLRSSGVGFNEDGMSTAGNRTAVIGMRKDVLGAFESLLNDLKLLDKADSPDDPGAIVVTGMAEGGHSKRKHGHGNGFAIDLRSETATRVAKEIVAGTTRLNTTSRSVPESHLLVKSEMLVGKKIFRYSGKYLLFGVEHQGKIYVCYFDSESTHRHIEFIPWEDYNVESGRQFAKDSKIPFGMTGIWRKEVRDYIRSQV